ncbi:MAG: hypothetical protein HGB19_00420 [Chlorobiales bacterium]|nr:hypothetical protein [Chlorobiales bacterium]
MTFQKKVLDSCFRRNDKDKTPSIELRNLFHQSFYRMIPLRNRMNPPFY